MTLEDYYNRLVDLTVQYGHSTLNKAIELVLNTMQAAMRERQEKGFVYFLTVPPSDAINRYVQPSEFLGREWIQHGKPVIVVVRSTSATTQTNAESIASADVRIRYVLDLIYPFTNISEEERSADTFYRFVDVFVEMFEQSGYSWVMGTQNDLRIYTDRTALSVDSNELLLYADVLCHVASCSVTFTLWYPLVTEKLEFGAI